MERLILNSNDYVLTVDLSILSNLICSGYIYFAENEEKWKKVDSKNANIINNENINNYLEDDNFIINGNLYVRYDVNLIILGSTNNLMTKFI